MVVWEISSSETNIHDCRGWKPTLRFKEDSVGHSKGWEWEGGEEGEGEGWFYLITFNDIEC